MKRLSAARADQRPIEEKALGLLFAMDDQAAARLHAMLKKMAAASSKRATMFLGANARRDAGELE